MRWMGKTLKNLTFLNPWRVRAKKRPLSNTRENGNISEGYGSTIKNAGVLNYVLELAKAI